MHNEPAVAEQNKHFMTLRGPAFDDLPSLHLEPVPGSPGMILAHNLPRVRWALALPQPPSQRIGLLEGKKDLGPTWRSREWGLGINPHCFYLNCALL